MLSVNNGNGKSRVNLTEEKTAGYKPTLLMHPYWLDQSMPPFTIWVIERMRLDPQVRLSTAVRFAPLMRPKFEIAGSPEVVRFVSNTLRHVWTSSIRKILKGMIYSISAGEILYEYDKDSKKYNFRGLNDVYPVDVRIRTREGKFSGVRVRMHRARNHAANNGRAHSADVVLRRPKAFIYLNEREFGSWTGRSMYEAAYKPWFDKAERDGALDIRRMWYYKCAYDSGDIYHPSGNYIDPDSGQIIPYQDIARQIVEQGKTGGAYAWPNTTDENGNRQWERRPAAGNGSGQDLISYADQLDVEISRGMLVPDDIVTQQSGTGSYSGRAIPLATFMAISNVSMTEVTTAIDELIIDPLVKMNFGDDQRYEILSAKVNNEEMQGEQQEGGPPQDGDQDGMVNDGTAQEAPPGAEQGQPSMQLSRMLELSSSKPSVAVVTHDDAAMSSRTLVAMPDWFQLAFDPNQKRSPIGGITIEGKFFKGGEWIKDNFYDAATPQQKAAIDKVTKQFGPTSTPQKPTLKGRAATVKAKSKNLQKSIQKAVQEALVDTGYDKSPPLRSGNRYLRAGMYVGEGEDRRFVSDYAEEVPEVSGKATFDIGHYLSEESAKSGKLDLNDPDPEMMEKTANALFADALDALAKDSNAGGWYDKHISQALAAMSLIHPEFTDDEAAKELGFKGGKAVDSNGKPILDDDGNQYELTPSQEAAAVFKTVLAITSNGQTVVKNFSKSQEIYEEFVKTGEINSDSKWAGKPHQAMEKSLKLVNRNIKKYGITNFVAFLNSPMESQEVKKFMKEFGEENFSTGELSGTPLRGAAIFGPKLGSFYGNLRGDFTSFTLDRWATRTLGRTSGTMADYSPSKLSLHASTIKTFFQPKKYRDTVLGTKPDGTSYSVSEAKNLAKDAFASWKAGSLVDGSDTAAWADGMVKRYDPVKDNNEAIKAAVTWHNSLAVNKNAGRKISREKISQQEINEFNERQKGLAEKDQKSPKPDVRARVRPLVTGPYQDIPESYAAAKDAMNPKSSNSVRSSALSQIFHSIKESATGVDTHGFDRKELASQAKAAEKTGKIEHDSELAQWIRASHASYSSATPLLDADGKKVTVPVKDDSGKNVYELDKNGKRVQKRETKTSSYQERSFSNNSAKNAFVNLYELNDAPPNGTYRKHARELLDNVQGKLRERGINLTNADLQAVLWFHEKDIFNAMGADAKRARPADYTAAALRLLNMHSGEDGLRKFAKLTGEDESYIKMKLEMANAEANKKPDQDDPEEDGYEEY